MLRGITRNKFKIRVSLYNSVAECLATLKRLKVDRDVIEDLVSRLQKFVALDL